MGPFVARSGSILTIRLSPCLGRRAASSLSTSSSAASRLNRTSRSAKAIEEVFKGTRHQRCWVHKTANVLKKVALSVQINMKADLREIYGALTRSSRDGDRRVPHLIGKLPISAEELHADRDGGEPDTGAGSEQVAARYRGTSGSSSPMRDQNLASSTMRRSGSFRSLIPGTEDFKQRARLEITHVPFAGSGTALIALVRGDVSLLLLSISLPSSHRRAPATRRIIAAAGEARAPTRPQLPTVDEFGVPGPVFETISDFGLRFVWTTI